MFFQPFLPCCLVVMASVNLPNGCIIIFLRFSNLAFKVEKNYIFVQQNYAVFSTLRKRVWPNFNRAVMLTSCLSPVCGNEKKNRSKNVCWKCCTRPQIFFETICRELFVQGVKFRLRFLIKMNIFFF